MAADFLFSPIRSDCVADVVTHLKKSGIWQPFDEKAVSFVNELSSRLLKYPGINKFPDLVALAYWFRRSNIKKLSQAYTNSDNFIRVGRGLALHISPSNVDTIFVYSFFLSLLSGNTNFIRVSQSQSAQLDILIELFSDIHNSGVSEASARFAICTYPHDNEVTSFVSQNCDLRLIWGGDATVSEIATIPLKPTALELKFANRNSFSAINLTAIERLSDFELLALVTSFYSDIRLFGQQACSSPRAVYFVGSREANDQSDRFWKLFRNVSQHHDLEPSQVMNRLVSASSMAVSGLVCGKTTSIGVNEVTVLNGNLSAGKSYREIHSGEGLIIQYFLLSLDDLHAQIIDKDQTLSIFGFDGEAVSTFVTSLSNRGIDRVVPIGKALDFGHIWDGSDLIDAMSRKIDISKIE